MSRDQRQKNQRRKELEELYRPLDEKTWQSVVRSLERDLDRYLFVDHFPKIR